jgi:hypothetical protein
LDFVLDFIFADLGVGPGLFRFFAAVNLAPVARGAISKLTDRVVDASKSYLTHWTHKESNLYDEIPLTDI